MDNCHLFGLKEVINENENLKSDRLRKKFIHSNQSRCRCFIKDVENKLPKEYWKFLDIMGDYPFMYTLKNLNSFKPHTQEGPVKKLTKHTLINKK